MFVFAFAAEVGGIQWKHSDVFHLGMQRGRKNKGSDDDKSYIFPVVQFIMWGLLWKTGEAENFYMGESSYCDYWLSNFI